MTGFEPAELIRRYSQLRLDYYRSLKTWPTFGRGWTRRTHSVERAALEMAAASNGGQNL